MADVFLSYNEKDREVVRRLAQALELAGWSVWWDRRIPAGMTWRSVLERELQNMRCMLVVWSTHSVKSDWVCEEATEGRLLGRLIPVKIEEVRPPAGFREVMAASLVGWDGSRDFIGLKELLMDIERLLGPSDHPVPIAARGPSGQGMPAAVAPRRWRWSAALLLLIAAGGAGLYLAETRRTASIDVVAPAERKKTETSPAAAVVPNAAGLNSTPQRRPTQPETSAAGPSKPVQTLPRTPLNPRCAALQERQAMGDPLTSEQQQFLQTECRK